MRREDVSFSALTTFGKMARSPTLQGQPAYKIHVDSWAASGAASNDYFSVRAIEQQHGVITNIFFVYSLLHKLNLCHVNSFYSFSRTRVHTQTSKHKEKDRRKKQRQRPWMSSGYVMCISLEGRLKRRFCFPHQRPHAGGFLCFSPIPTLPLPYCPFHE